MKHFNSILYVREPSVAQAATLERAVTLAENNQAELTVIDIVPPLVPSAAAADGASDANRLQDALLEQRRVELEAMVAPFRGRRDLQTDVHTGRTYIEIIRAVLRRGHDLLIKPAENPDFIARLFGSNDMQLLRMCPCPVWLMQPDEPSNYSCILAAIDVGTDDAPGAPEPGLNREILEIAGSLAVSDFAALHVMHVWDAPAESMVRLWSDHPGAAVTAYVDGERTRHERVFARARDDLRELLGQDAFDHVAPHMLLQRGRPATVIPETSRLLQANVVVMGTVARTGIAGVLIGNTAEAILEQLQCSVLAIKPPGFVSPVQLQG